MTSEETKSLIDVEQTLIKILGEDAFYSTDFKVTQSVSNLCHAVHYLATQIQITATKFDEKEELIHHTNGVMTNLIDILHKG